MTVELCKNGHVRTEENTRWHKDTSRNRVRKRCLDCKNAKWVKQDGPCAAEMAKQATTFLHEDIEDLLKFGATYSEILERGGYSCWNTMYKSLKRRGRFDLIDALREKKVASK